MKKFLAVVIATILTSTSYAAVPRNFDYDKRENRERCVVCTWTHPCPMPKPPLPKPRVCGNRK